MALEKMRNALPKIVGKTVRGVVVKRALKGARPAWQVFLIFTDDTHLEFYGTEFTTCSDIDPQGADWVRRYMASSHEIMLDAVQQPVAATPAAVAPSSAMIN